ncbi:hypothetical protein FRC03_008397, partial [Tulasnella sp. 419]
LGQRKCDKPEWFWGFDITHPGVPLYPSPRHRHPPRAQSQPMMPQTAIHPPTQQSPSRSCIQAVPYRQPSNPPTQKTSNVPNQPPSQRASSDPCRA